MVAMMNANAQRTPLFAPKVLFFLVLMLSLCAFGGAGLVWFRQEIAESAQRIRADETQIAELERRLRYFESKIAGVHQPEYLKRRAVEFGINLDRPDGSQVVRMTLNGNGRNRPEQIDETPQEPIQTSFDLAFLESQNGNPSP